MVKTNKPQLVAYLQNKALLTEEQALMVLKALYLFALENLEKQVGVVLPDIGQIKISQAKNGVGRDFKTGELTRLKPRAKLVFSVSKTLKDALEEKSTKFVPSVGVE